MATLNRATRELTCKIVYYGPGWGGKTTNLRQIHSTLPEKNRGELTSLATHEDRTLFFDLLPIEIGRIGDYEIKVRLYTVPGQVRYDATRRLVLRGADGVVMVFDSDPELEDSNRKSLANLRVNLATHGLHLEEMPVVFQYNKRDLPSAMSIEQMSAGLNPSGQFAEVEAVATQGPGVMDTVRRICGLVFERIESRMSTRDRTHIEIRAQVKSGEGAKRRRRERPRRPVAKSEPSKAPAPRDEPGEPASKIMRFHQMSDLMLSGLLVGHAVVDLAAAEHEGEAPEVWARLEIRPMIGPMRVAETRFVLSERTASSTDGLALFEAESKGPHGATRLGVERREGRPPRFYLDWQTPIATLRIVPEGSAIAGAGSPQSHG